MVLETVTPECRAHRAQGPSGPPAAGRRVHDQRQHQLESTSVARFSPIATGVGSLAASVRVFDEYRGPQVGDDRKSLAVRVTLQRFDATLTDEEADEAIARALQALRDGLGAVIRE